MNGIDVRPWARAVTKMLAFAEQQNASIIGITGDRPAVGVSMLSRECARPLAWGGRHVLLVDASRLDMPDDAQSGEGLNAPLDLLAMATKTDEGVFAVDLARTAIPAFDRQKISQLFEGAVANDVAVIVDLPALHARTTQEARTLSLIGSACHLVYLVCMSGVVTKDELSDCVERCKINRIPLGGLIVNDWKQPIARIASR